MALQAVRLLPAVERSVVLGYLGRRRAGLGPITVDRTSLHRGLVIVQILVVLAGGRRASDARLVEIGELQHAAKRTPAAIRPAHDADPRRVDIRKSHTELSDGGDVVIEPVDIELAIGRMQERARAVRRAAPVNRYDNKTQLG